MLSLFIMIAILGGGQQSPPADDQTPIDVVAQKAKEKRIVCKSSVPTGTLFQRKDCKSQAEWERIEARSKAYMDRVMEEQREEMSRKAQCESTGRC